MSVYLLDTPASYYFRIKVPKDLRSVIKKREIKLSLKTENRQRATRLAALHAFLWQEIFNRLRGYSVTDAPRKVVQVDYQVLEHTIENSQDFPKFFGLTTLDGPSSVNATHIYSLTQVAHNLGYKSWHSANALIQRIEAEKGIDIKKSDNRYHVAVKIGINSIYHKYSDLCLDVLQKVGSGQSYDVIVS